MKKEKYCCIDFEYGCNSVHQTFILPNIYGFKANFSPVNRNFNMEKIIYYCPFCGVNLKEFYKITKTKIKKVYILEGRTEF